jgi:hypothetical protein
MFCIRIPRGLMSEQHKCSALKALAFAWHFLNFSHSYKNILHSHRKQLSAFAYHSKLRLSSMSFAFTSQGNFLHSHRVRELGSFCIRIAVRLYANAELIHANVKQVLAIPKKPAILKAGEANEPNHSTKRRLTCTSNLFVVKHAIWFLVM